MKLIKNKELKDISLQNNTQGMKDTRNEIRLNMNKFDITSFLNAGATFS